MFLLWENLFLQQEKIFVLSSQNNFYHLIQG